MPGGGLTAPKKLSPELADIVGKKTASRAELMKLLWAYIKKNNLQVRYEKEPQSFKLFNICLPPPPRTPTTSSTSFPTRRWPRSSDLRRSEASAWPRASDPISLKESAPHFYTSTKINKKMKTIKYLVSLHRS